MTLDQMKELSKRLARMAKEFGHAADNQHDCCHGDNAQTELEQAETDLLVMAKEIDLAIIDQERRELR